VAERLYAVPSAWGDFVAGFTGRGLSTFRLPARGRGRSRLPELAAADESLAAGLLGPLRRYIAGERVEFRIRLDLSRGTPFQRKVWRRMCRIPYGRTMAYGELARAIGSPGAARAVGSACGHNPVALIVPCHRVVAAGGLGGFGSGRAMKRKMLRHEGVDLGRLEAR